MVSIARLSLVKQRSFGLPGQYGRRVTRVNSNELKKKKEGGGGGGSSSLSHTWDRALVSVPRRLSRDSEQPRDKLY